MKHLIMGGGSIGKRHLKNLHFIGERELFCYKRQFDSTFEEEFACRVITTFEEVKEIKPDVIYICNPTSLHHQGIEWAQEIGCHVFMEKPLTHDFGILRLISQKWKNDHVFFIGFVLRYHPLLIKLKEKLEEKSIGEIFYSRFEFGSYLPDWHPGEDFRSSYAGVKSLGGGVINTVSHELDLMLHLFGEPKSVVAAKANLHLLQIETEEIAEAIFEYHWGLATLHLDFLQKKYDRHLRITCTKGELLLNWQENKLTIKRDNEVEVIQVKSDINQLYINELKDFFELIKSESLNHSLDFKNAVTHTKWMLLIHQSAEKKRQWEKLLTNSLI
jgi:predicted dehydrogenase